MAAARRPSTGVVLFAWAGGAAFLVSLGYFLYAYLWRFGDPSVGAHPGGALRGTVIDVSLFTVFALHHSLAARWSFKRRLSRLVPDVLERSCYTWIASLLFIGVCAAWQAVPGELYRLTGPASLVGYGVQLAGIVLTVRSSARLDVLDLAGIRAVLTASHGRPAARVPLVTRGLYGFVRHPLYFSWMLLVFGAPHMTFTRLVFALVSTGYLAIAIPMEERGLIRTFGADYRSYQQQVRWRMIPGLY